MKAAEKCFRLDLRLGANLCASYQAAVGLCQLVVSIYLIVRFLYWGLVTSSILYLLVAAVGLAATNNWKSVLTYAPEVVRSAHVYFICTAGLAIAEVFAACWQITKAGIDYTSCISVPGLDESSCFDRYVLWIAISAWNATALAVLAVIVYFAWSYSSRLSQGLPVMHGQHPNRIRSPPPHPAAPQSVVHELQPPARSEAVGTATQPQPQV